MKRYIAFLHGINPNGMAPVKMNHLRESFEMEGICNISTYTLSGNVLFESEETNEIVLRDKIQKNLFQKLGYEVTVVLREFDELKKIIKNNPYDHIKTEDTRALYVTLLSDVPDYSVRGALGLYSTDAHDARLVQRDVYILSADYGRTCFTNTLIEKKLGVAATTRNWDTINKLIGLYRPR